MYFLSLFLHFYVSDGHGLRLGAVIAISVTIVILIFVIVMIALLWHRRNKIKYDDQHKLVKNDHSDGISQVQTIAEPPETRQKTNTEQQVIYGPTAVLFLNAQNTPQVIFPTINGSIIGQQPVIFTQQPLAAFTEQQSVVTSRPSVSKISDTNGTRRVVPTVEPLAGLPQQHVQEQPLVISRNSVSQIQDKNGASHVPAGESLASLPQHAPQQQLVVIGRPAAIHTLETNCDHELEPAVESVLADRKDLQLISTLQIAFDDPVNTDDFNSDSLTC